MRSDGVDWILAAHETVCRFRAYEGSNYPSLPTKR